MHKIEQIISAFIEIVNQKTEEIKQQEFYKLHSPLELNMLFKKKPEAKSN
jgi:hypothetical protein